MNREIYGNNDLIEASKKRDTKIVEELLNDGADPNIKDENEQTPLILASQNGYTEIVDLLLNAKADPNIQDEWVETALIKASRYGYTEIVEKLLNAKADPNIQDEEDDLQYKNRNTALMYSIEHNNIEIVELLLKNGAKVDKKNKWGDTALNYASHKCYTEIVKLLIKYGADISVLSEKEQNIYGNIIRKYRQPKAAKRK